jgi:hypothetical protein
VRWTKRVCPLRLVQAEISQSAKDKAAFEGAYRARSRRLPQVNLEQIENELRPAG